MIPKQRRSGTLTLVKPPDEILHIPVDVRLQNPDDRIWLIVVTAAKWPPDGPEYSALTTWLLSSSWRQPLSWSYDPIQKKIPLIKVKRATLV